MVYASAVIMLKNIYIDTAIMIANYILKPSFQYSI